MKSVGRLIVLFIIVSFASVVNANGWNSYVDSMSDGGGSSDALGGILMVIVLGALIIFSWAIWGKDSIRYTYGPMLLGWVAMFIVSGGSERLFSIRGIVFGLPLGLIFGWLILGGLTLLGVIDYFKPDEGQGTEKKNNK